MIEGIRALDLDGHEIVVYGGVQMLGWAIYYDGTISLYFKEEGDEE